MACFSALETPGNHKRTPGPRVGGFRRTYLVHIPRNFDASKPTPLVVALHGAFSDARSFARHSALSRVADREGFIVAYPNGIGLFGLLRHWNSGHCCGKALKDGIDDVGFVMSVVDEIAAELPVDRTRTYIVGYSNGGMLAHRIAAERSGSFAAAAIVAGTIGGRPGKNAPEWTISPPVAPMPIVMFHGREDRNVPYEGGTARGGMTVIPVRRSAEYWIDQNRCGDPPAVERPFGGKVLRESWAGCSAGADVVLYSIDDWGHAFPGSRFTRKLRADDPLRTLEAADLIWDFFEHRRRADPTARP